MAIIGKGALLLVADGVKALILSNDDTAAEPSIHVVWKAEQSAGRDRATACAPPSSLTRADQQDRTEAAFLTAAAQEFAERARGKPRVPLLIAAPPTGLALIRRALPKDLRTRVSAQIPNDLARMPLPAILAHFKAAS